MAFIVVYDANVLYPNTLRDLLIRIAQLPHIVQAKWTDEILDDFVRDTMGIDSQAVWACVQQIVDSRTRRPVTVEDVLGELQRDGLVASVAAMRMR
jgi:hypothetical protein